MWLYNQIKSSTLIQATSIAGACIEVFWNNSTKYYTGFVQDYDSNSKASIKYDDGGRELLQLADADLCDIPSRKLANTVVLEIWVILKYLIALKI